MDINALHDRILEAAEPERRLPAAMRRQKLASWPDYPLDWHGYGWTQVGEVMLRPTADQISNLDWVMDRVLSLTERDRNIVWAAAHSAAFRQRGPRWSRIGKTLGLDPRVVKDRNWSALIRLYYSEL